MKMIKEIYSSIILAILLTGAIQCIFNEMRRNESQVFCAEKMMYMQIHNTVLAYPTAQDQMTCAVYEYQQQNKEKK